MVLAVVLLAVGIAGGAAIGPAPSSSLAGTQRASLLAESLGLVARERTAQTAPGHTETTTTTESPPAPTAIRVHRKHHKHLATQSASSSEAPGEEPASSEASGSQEQTSKQKPSKSQSQNTPGAKTHPSALTHVWLIDLSGQSFAGALAQEAADPYLAKQLVQQGTLLSNYTLTASSPLANDIALLSGQGVNADTEQDCPTYSEVQPPALTSNGLTEGIGCVYPKAVQTLADQLSVADLTWRAYLQDMAPTAPATTTSGPTTTPSAPANPAEASTGASCRHPALGASEPLTAPTAGEDYLGFRNPFVYFDSLLQSGACASDDLDSSQLGSSLASPATTPNLSWIVPSACHDGTPTQCAPGSPSGLAAADAFLEEVVPPILASDAYKSSGLIVITFDSGPPPAPNAAPGSGAPADVGALLLSPFVKRNSTLKTDFNTFSLLKSLEQLYGVPLLGHAADPAVEQFGDGIYRATETAAKAASPVPHRAADHHPSKS
jgi:phosphatidylinositol-3-phosphatase